MEPGFGAMVEMGAGRGVAGFGMEEEIAAMSASNLHARFRPRCGSCKVTDGFADTAVPLT